MWYCECSTARLKEIKAISKNCYIKAVKSLKRLALKLHSPLKSIMERINETSEQTVAFPIPLNTKIVLILHSPNFHILKVCLPQQRHRTTAEKNQFHTMERWTLLTTTFHGQTEKKPQGLETADLSSLPLLCRGLGSSEICCRSISISGPPVGSPSSLLADGKDFS